MINNYINTKEYQDLEEIKEKLFTTRFILTIECGKYLFWKLYKISYTKKRKGRKKQDIGKIISTEEVLRGNIENIEKLRGYLKKRYIEV